MSDEELEALLETALGPATAPAAAVSAAASISAAIDHLRTDDPRRTHWTPLTDLLLLGEVHSEEWEARVKAARLASGIWRMIRDEEGG